MPADFERFVTAAHTSSVNAAKAPWSAKITRCGYPATRLTALNAALESLTTTGADTVVAEGDAQESTAAYKALRDFVKELRGCAAASSANAPAPSPSSRVEQAR